MSSKVLLIAWRDFKHTVLTKAFLFAVIGMPLLLAAVGLIAFVIMADQEKPALEGRIAVIDSTGELLPIAREMLDPARLAEERQRQMEEAAELTRDMTGADFDVDMTMMNIPGGFGTVRVDVELEQHDASETDDLRERVRTGDLLALVHFDESILTTLDQDEDDPGFELVIAESLISDHTTLLARRLGDAVVRARLLRAGLDPDATQSLLSRPEPATTRLLESGDEKPEDEATRALSGIIPAAFLMLVWITTFSTGQHLLMSTIEEKSNKVMEVLLSAVSPMQLLTGKIIGQGCAGLIIVLVYASVGIGSLVAASSAHLIPPEQLLYLAVYFLMAYLMIAALMTAVGSAVSDVREANSLLTPVMILLFVPLMLWLPISQAPNGALATTFSFIPPAIPFVMILRAAADEGVPIWQIPVTMVWGFLCVYAMIWAGSRIFRVGVLMQGKPPSPLQLLKWIRYS